MIIKGDRKYIPELLKLWKEVFSDPEEYIKIFFDNIYCKTECFAKTANGEIVSALYLIKGQINFNGEVFCGRYLYAAATKSDYRKQGFMAELIKETIDYAQNENLDFICLLPANEELYGYYAKFGFKDLMYKFKTTLNKAEKQNAVPFKREKSLHKARKLIGENMFVFSEGGNNYALKCFNYAGYDLYNLSAEFGFDCLIIADSKFKEIVEVICKKENYKKTEEYFEKYFSPDTEISSPYEGEKGEKIKFGMIYPINKKLSGAEIYMNIALD